jgi:membrane-associated phospholipid phosphatase
MSRTAVVSVRERSPRAWSGPLAVTLGAGFLLLALLVATGALARLDGYAASHLMPGLKPDRHIPSLLDSIVPWSGGGSDGGVTLAADVVTAPAGALVSCLLLAAGALFVLRRTGRRAVLLTLAAFALGNLVELLLKSTLERPAVEARWYGTRFHVLGFDSSFPSGHALRGLFLAGTVAVLWPRARPLLAAWVAALVVMLEVAGFHTPSDIAGGLLLSGSLLLGLASLLPRRATEPAASRSRPAADARVEITPPLTK